MRLGFYTITNSDGQRYAAIEHPNLTVAANNIGVPVENVHPGIEPGLPYWTARIPTNIAKVETFRPPIA